MSRHQSRSQSPPTRTGKCPSHQNLLDHHSHPRSLHLPDPGNRHAQQHAPRPLGNGRSRAPLAARHRDCRRHRLHAPAHPVHAPGARPPPPSSPSPSSSPPPASPRSISISPGMDSSITRPPSTPSPSRLERPGATSLRATFEHSQGTELWVRHYAKGPWYFAAAIFDATGYVEWGKSINLLALAASALAVFAAALDPAGLTPPPRAHPSSPSSSPSTPSS